MASASWNSFDAPTDRSEEASLPSDAEIVRRNLDLLAAEENALQARRALQISELSALLSLPEHAALRDELSDFAVAAFQYNDTLRSSEDTARFCLEMIRRGYPIAREGHSDELFGSGEPISQKASGRVAYLRSRVADEAFLALTAPLQKPKAAYFSSFSDVCEEVYHGLCEYCILPVESADGGKLLSFYSLIEKFELRIVSVTDLDDGKGGYTRYALLSHRYVSPYPIGASGKRCYAEFLLVLNDRLSLSDVLLAAELLGMRVTRTDSFPLPDRRDAYRYGLVFLLPEGAELAPTVEAFLLYLSVSLPEYTPLGVYTKL